MPYKKYEFLAPGTQFLKKINKKHRVIVYVDSDGDGITSGVILSEYFEEKNIEHDVKFLKPEHRIEQESLVKKLVEESNPTHFISCDNTLTSAAYSELKNAKIKTLTIDHHLTHTPSHGELVNPHGKVKEYPSSSALTLRLCKEAGLKKDLDWVGILGAAYDWMLYDSIPIMNLKDVNKDTFIIGNRIHPIMSKIVDCFDACAMKPRLNKVAFNLLKKSVRKENPLLIWEEKNRQASELFAMLNIAEINVLYYLENVKRLADFNDESKIVYLKLEGEKFNILKTLSGSLTLKYPEHTIIVSSDDGAQSKLNFKSHSINLTKTIKDALKKVPNATGGGHSFAAGAVMPTEYEKEFLETFTEKSQVHSLR